MQIACLGLKIHEQPSQIRLPSQAARSSGDMSADSTKEKVDAAPSENERSRRICRPCLGLAESEHYENTRAVRTPTITVPTIWLFCVMQGF